MRLVGRQREQADLRRLIGGDARLIAVSGRAGVGKTALLSALTTAPPKGVEVWPVDVRGTGTDGPLLDLVVRGMGVGPSAAAGGTAAVRRMAGMVGRSPVVIAVDHAEGCVVDESALAPLFDACPRLQLVVAQADAPAEGERGIALLPLDVPPLDASAQDAVGFSSVQLFLDRAKRADASFHHDEPTTEAVTRVVRLLGGLPLAIELAAARVRMLAPARLAEVLAEDGEAALDLLTPRGRRGVGGLRAALASTWATLDDGERDLCESVAAFAGPFPFAAALAVADDGAALVADRLERLVDLRLVERETGEGDPAFVMVPIVRRFAAERLALGAGREGVDVARSALLDEMLGGAVAAVAAARGHQTLDDARVMRIDLVADAEARFGEDPIAAAGWLVGCAQVLQGHAESARIAEMLEQVIASGDVDRLDVPTRAAVWLWSANALAFSPDGASLAATIRDRLARGIELNEAHAAPMVRLQGMMLAIETAVTTGDLAQAAAMAHQARELALESAQAGWAARFAVWAAAGAHTALDFDRAAQLGLESLHEAERLDDARTYGGAALLLSTLPPGSLPEGTPVPTLHDALAMARRRRDAETEWFLMGGLTRVELAAGRLGDAAGWCADRLTRARTRGWTYLAAISLVHTVLIAVAFGDFAFAARILGAVAADRDRVLRAMAPASSGDLDRARAMLGERLGAAHAAALIAAGGALTTAEAAAESVRWLRAHQDGPSVEQSSPSPLTERETDVLDLLAEGLTNKEIAVRMHLSVKTVMHHSGAIYRKLGVRGRAEATAHALRHGLTGGARGVLKTDAKALY